MKPQTGVVGPQRLLQPCPAPSSEASLAAALEAAGCVTEVLERQPTRRAGILGVTEQEPWQLPVRSAEVSVELGAEGCKCLMRWHQRRGLSEFLSHPWGVLFAPDTAVCCCLVCGGAAGDLGGKPHHYSDRAAGVDQGPETLKSAWLLQPTYCATCSEAAARRSL